MSGPPTDGTLKSIAMALKYLGTGDAATTMGALEYHATEIAGGLNAIADAIRRLAECSRTDVPLMGGSLGGAAETIADAIKELR